MRITIDQIYEFCRSNDNQLVVREERHNGCTVLIKYQYDDNTYMLFSGYTYHQVGANLSFDTKLEYVGFYSKLTDVLYDVGYSLVGTNYKCCQSRHDLTQLINEKVTEKINIIISSDKEQLKRFIPKDKRDSIREPEEYQLKDMAERAFLRGSKPEFKISVNENMYPMNYLINFVNDRNFHSIIANEKLINNAISYYESFLRAEGATKLYDRIEADKTHHLHYMRRILQVEDILEEVAPNRVNIDVTIDKDGKEFTFRMPVDKIKMFDQSTGRASIWWMPTKLEKEYEAVYGRRINNSFNVKDVKLITCGKHTLYDRAAFEAELRKEVA